jgi:glycosyltransferase involved in cell wall biosynthesis
MVLRRMSFVQAFLTVSEAGAVALRPLVPAGTAVEWLDNAIDVRAQPTARPGVDPATLLFVGTLSRRKGLAELAAAAAALRDELPSGWSLQVAGGPAEVGEEEAAEMRHEFHRRGLQDALLGGRPPADVRELMAGASMLVLPSHWEGQPMVILEAMACGMPVVSTTVGAIPSVVRDGLDGFLVPPYDVPALTNALRTLVESPDLRIQMGESARTRAMTKYDVSVLASRLAPFYAGP